MEKLIRDKDLKVWIYRILYEILSDKADNYNTDQSLLDKKITTGGADDIIKLYKEFRDESAKYVYVLLNTVDYTKVYSWYSEEIFRERLNTKFKRVIIDKESYIPIIEELLKHYNQVLDSCNSKNRRIKKTDSSDLVYAIKINRTVIKMQKKKINAINEYLELLKQRLEVITVA